jgi:hypothetical protein
VKLTFYALGSASAGGARHAILMGVIRDLRVVDPAVACHSGEPAMSGTRSWRPGGACRTGLGAGWPTRTRSQRRWSSRGIPRRRLTHLSGTRRVVERLLQ